MTKNIKLKAVQYKILHNAYPTMNHLFHYRIKNSPNCQMCHCVETIEHALWTCPVAIDTINKVQNILRRHANINLTISKEEFLFGTADNMAISTIFTLLKRKIILQREDKRILTDNEIIQCIREEISVEKFIAVKNKSIDSFHKKWSSIAEI